ncbi:hypothetical protein Goshw_028805, partial [Gossypium schwendimanii]|nr:hypothetical protein [Gossypium schwendimanii]
DADFLISSNARTRRLLKYNPYKGVVFVLYNGLAFPNGRNKNGSRRLGIIENDAPDPIKMKFNEEAKVLKILNGKGAPTFKSISEVKE